MRKVVAIAAGVLVLILVMGAAVGVTAYVVGGGSSRSRIGHATVYGAELRADSVCRVSSDDLDAAARHEVRFVCDHTHGDAVSVRIEVTGYADVPQKVEC